VTRQELDRQLLEAHSQHDHPALIRLYGIAADQAEAAGDEGAACFYLTHAFVFALEYGAPQADALNLRLYEKGRAHRLQF
jgi:hypothetical protein